MGRWSSRGTTSSYRQLDVRLLQRRGWLKPGYWFSLGWTRNGEPHGSIGGRVELDRIILSYSHRERDEAWQPLEASIWLDWTPCRYGGQRGWFLCPARGCGRRVAVLYVSRILACRHCHNLAYESQREQPYQRALRRAQKIHTRLGGTPAMDSFPDKTRGMHWRTYRMLYSKAEQAEARSWPLWLSRCIDSQDPTGCGES